MEVLMYTVVTEKMRKGNEDVKLFNRRTQTALI